MTGRTLLSIAILAVAIEHAGAQFGGMPGTPPGGPGTGGFGNPPSGPPPQCQALLSIRDDLQKHGAAIQAANKKKSDVKIACQLFRTYIATEAKMLRMLEADGSSCGAGPQVLQQVRDSHVKAQQIGKQVCDAARGPYRYDLPPEHWREYNPDRDRRERWRQYQRLAGAATARSPSGSAAATH
jgi:hypothetical protein